MLRISTSDKKLKEKFDYIKRGIEKNTGKRISTPKTFSILLNTYIEVDPTINKVPKRKELKIKW